MRKGITEKRKKSGKIDLLDSEKFLEKEEAMQMLLCDM